MTLEQRVESLERKVEEIICKNGKFNRPSPADIYSYMRERLKEKDSFLQSQSEMFFNHYESNGWKVGKVAMKDWKAAVRNWVSNIKNKTFNGTNYSTDSISKSIPVGNIPQGGFGHL